MAVDEVARRKAFQADAKGRLALSRLDILQTETQSLRQAFDALWAIIGGDPEE